MISSIFYILIVLDINRKKVKLEKYKKIWYNNIVM